MSLLGEAKRHGERRDGIVAVSKSGSGALHNSRQRWRKSDGLGGVDLLVAHRSRDGCWEPTRGRHAASRPAKAPPPRAQLMCGDNIQGIPPRRPHLTHQPRNAPSTALGPSSSPSMYSSAGSVYKPAACILCFRGVRAIASHLPLSAFSAFLYRTRCLPLSFHIPSPVS